MTHYPDLEKSAASPNPEGFFKYGSAESNIPYKPNRALSRFLPTGEDGRSVITCSIVVSRKGPVKEVWICRERRKEVMSAGRRRWPDC